MQCGKDFVNPEMVPGMSPEILQEVREAAAMARAQEENGNV